MNGKHIAADLLPSDRPSKQQRRLTDMAGMAEGAVAMESTKEPLGDAAQANASPHGALMDQFNRLIELGDPHTAQGLDHLDLYLSMWEFYVVKSAHVLQLEAEVRKLQKSFDWANFERADLRQQLAEEQLVLDDRRRDAKIQRDGLLSIIQASEFLG